MWYRAKNFTVRPSNFVSFLDCCLFSRSRSDPARKLVSCEIGTCGGGWFADAVDRAIPLRRGEGLHSHAQQRVIVIDVEQRSMIAADVAVGCCVTTMVRVAAEVLKNPVGGAS